MKVEWSSGLVAHLGIEFLEVTPDRVVARLKVGESLLTIGGTIHGGTLMAFADTVGAAGTVANLQEGQRTATLESKTNFIAGCRSGYVRAEARPIHKGRRTHVWETRITDEAGKLLSVTTQTQIVL
jgi:1,4-dihydroxy-2-naphthoyl-CoA hydrolase